MSDCVGSVTDKYSYDEWGETARTYGLTSDNPYQYVGRLGYYTHYQEPDFSLLQLGVRYYDAEIGRFMQLDLIKDGVNWYVYVDGNPMVGVDPKGTFEWPWTKYFKCKEFYDSWLRASRDCKNLYWAKASNEKNGPGFICNNPNPIKWITDCAKRRMTAWYGTELKWYIENCAESIKEIVDILMPDKL